MLENAEKSMENKKKIYIETKQTNICLELIMS